MFGPLVTLAAAGLLLGITVVFWAMLQNWMAGVISRAEARLGRLTHTLQSGLVILDRIIVNGQRLVSATARLLFQNKETADVVTTEEVRQIDPQALPADVLARLDSGQQMTYDVSSGSA